MLSKTRPPRGPKLWLRLLAPALGAIAGLVALRALTPQWLNQPALSGSLQHLGRWAPLAFAALLTVRPIALLPGQVLTAVGGLLFGTFWGGLYAMIGSITSGVLVYVLARRLGKPLLRKAAGGSYRAVARAAQQHSFQAAVLMTVNPLFPTDLAIALAAAAKARLWPTLSGVLVGTLPGTFLTAAFGSALGQGKTLMTAASAAAVVVSLVLGTFLGKRVFDEAAEPRPPGANPAPFLPAHP